ncbi:hypothetical protein [Aquiflexum gelatinilyticum]|uniref:Uncharacterized protein n=1 Tax=Aquiflexum gelatinilyticum TaxID=2961943 RepID=A0A9X2P6W3_9BACT|nr:hypothetical protein [Aquiflexum gelatinilyticum]MCR9014805.1 hypothetical protein [Aquiflexum gelatinilyticum]
MEIKDAVKILKEKGRIKVKDGHGTILELVAPQSWDATKDDQDGIFLFFEVFQIRHVAEQFSEVSLDIIEYATKPTIYRTPVNRILKNGPIFEGKVKFAVIRKDFWNRFLFAFSQPLILQFSKSKDWDMATEEFFPLLSAGTKEMFLSPDGDVKIIRA